MNKVVYNIFLSTLLVGGIANLPTDAVADNGKGKGGEHEGNKGKPTQINFDLAPSDPALTDLASAAGKFRFRSKGGKSEFKGRIRLPATAPSLGITDITTAQAALIHIEFLREGVAYNDCTLTPNKFDEDEAAESIDHFDFKLHIKTNGKKDVKGSCTNGVPDLKDGDSVIGYGLVGEVKIPFLSN